MRYYLSYVENNSGVALITGLVIMVLLTAIGTYAINMTEIEETLAANLKASKQAFYAADAGIEWGRQQISASLALPPVPATATQSLNAGNYTVTFPKFFPRFPAYDYTVMVRSVGNVGNVGNVGTASKELRALVTKTFDLSDAAIAMRGNEAHSSFTGSAFLVDGRDYDHLTGTLTAAAPQLGISVPSTSLETVVEGALATNQKDRVKGLDGTATNPSVGVSTALTSSTITAIANALCPALAQSYTPVSGNIKISGNKAYGSNASPQITCFDGLGTPGAMGVDLSGDISGSGILIVKNADLVASGNFSYNGLIIVTGNKVGFGMIGGGKKDVYGSVLINETNWDGSSYKELVLTGNSSVMRSQSALAMAKQLLPAETLAGIIPGLPSSTQRVSWMEVNN
jgi:hypothetical protein